MTNNGEERMPRVNADCDGCKFQPTFTYQDCHKYGDSDCPKAYWKKQDASLPLAPKHTDEEYEELYDINEARKETIKELEARIKELEFMLECQRPLLSPKFKEARK
jgi:hypothetical protein